MKGTSDPLKERGPLRHVLHVQHNRVKTRKNAAKMFMIKASLWPDDHAEQVPDDGMMKRLVCLILHHDEYYCYWGKFKAYTVKEFCVSGCCSWCTL